MAKSLALAAGAALEAYREADFGACAASGALQNGPRKTIEGLEQMTLASYASTFHVVGPPIQGSEGERFT